MNIWTGGTFDLIHPGHAALLRNARQLAMLDGMRPGHMVTVAVNTDDFIERFKGRRPVQPANERAEMVAAMRWVNEVQMNDGTEQPELILRSNADVVLIGDDWGPPKDYMGQIGVDDQWLYDHGVDIRYLPRVGGHSSTRLKAAVSARRLR